MKKAMTRCFSVIAAIALILAAEPCTAGNAALENLRRQAIRYADNLDYRNAKKCWEKGLRLARKQKNRRYTSKFLNNIGIVHQARGDVHTSLKYYKEAYSISADLDNETLRATYASNTARMLFVVPLPFIRNLTTRDTGTSRHFQPSIGL